jgi:ankyrin repeat protein
MSKPNEKSPCGSKDLGVSHPSFRFSIGDRIETDLNDPDETEGHPQWIPGTIRGFNANIGAYDILLDYPVGKYGRDAVSLDTNNFTRPFGFTKSATHKTDPCATCGVNEPTDGGVKFVQCAGCRRTRYCTRACQKTDWKNHRVQCQAIVAQNKRVSVEIKELIKTGKSEAVNNALINAVHNDDLVIIRKLLKKRRDDINVNAVDDDGSTPLIIASQEGHTNIVAILLGTPGIQINQADNGGASPLFFASQYGHTDIVTILLGTPGIQINQPDNDGTTPLYMAAQNGHLDIVKVLIEADGDVNQADNGGFTPLWIASQYGYTDIVTILLGTPAIQINQANNAGASPLWIASVNGNVDTVKVLLAAGGNVNQARTKDGCSPLYQASQNGHTGVLKVLIEAGGNVNQRVTETEEKDCTPLIIASYLGQASCVEILLSSNDIDFTATFEGRTAFMWAQPDTRSPGLKWIDDDDVDLTINVKGREQIVQLLIAADAQ